MAQQAMSLDVVDLRAFYASALGRVAHRFVSAVLERRWDNCNGLSMLGIGYATPYLTPWRGKAQRVLAFMPAQQGVVNWPDAGLSASALVDTTMLPLPDSCIDRVLLIHALEMSEAPREVLEEIWRILTPGGRVMIVAPNRRSVWARVETTPFAQGLPYSRGQLRELLRETLFSPVHECEALYVPPFASPFALRMAPAFERIGEKFGLPGGGVHIIEATKQLYRPIVARKLARRRLTHLQGALAPSPAGIGYHGSSRDDHAAR
jgi:SAM-dependent methyltransferase